MLSATSSAGQLARAQGKAQGILGLLTVLMLLPTAKGQEFRWRSGAAITNSTSNPAQVPAGAWPSVTVEVVGAHALSGDRFTTRSGWEVCLEGIQAPQVQPAGSAASRGGALAKARLEKLVAGQTLQLEFEGFRRLPSGAWLAHVKNSQAQNLSVRLVEEGHARPLLEAGGIRYDMEILQAARAARSKKRGLHAVSPAFRVPPAAETIRGFSLGLYSQEADFDYSGLLTSLAATGATHVLLMTPHFMKTWQSVTIAPLTQRTAPLKTVARTARQARALGLRVSLMPIVLLRTGTSDHWRGSIEPVQRMAWFHSYGRMLGEWADVAHEVGADVLVIGSEFCSLENEGGRWRSLIRSVRARFEGRLTYSANWDQLEVVSFWDALDYIGMTGYHELTKSNEPSLDELQSGWAGVSKQIQKVMEQVKRPALFTEIGYASQDGANKHPWDYTASEVPDSQEQALCYEAFVKVWSSPPKGFMGAWIYNWWRNGDRSDRTNYSLQGKPALKVLEPWLQGKPSGQK